MQCSFHLEWQVFVSVWRGLSDCAGAHHKSSDFMTNYVTKHPWMMCGKSECLLRLELSVDAGDDVYWSRPAGSERSQH
jgi:hypothetical protein